MELLIALDTICRFRSSVNFITGLLGIGKASKRRR
jgi:hypothetical protein